MQRSNDTESIDSADLSDDIRRARSQLRELMDKVQCYVDNQHVHALTTNDIDEQQRLVDANPQRWLDEARHSLQAGLMFIDRTVSQPTSF